MREEQARREEEIAVMLRRHDEELQLLQGSRSQPSQQLNPPNNRARIENLNFKLGYKLKPDNYDGSVPLREFLTQFDLIARANNWSDSHKTVAFTAYLRGKARSVLDGIFEIENLNFEDLKSKLELRFGEGHLAQTYYTQFTNRKQRNSENLASLD